jgi:drug/metabolite transporter (DMT)-like permease
MIAASKIVLVMFLWAVCFPLITAGFAYAPHLTFAALRAFLAGAALISLGLVLGRPLPRGHRVWIMLAFIGLGATSLGYLGMFMAAEFVLPGIATVLANTQPLMAAILAGFFLNENLGRVGWIGMGLGLGGIVLIALPQMFAGSSGNFSLGLAYILMAALGITISNVMIRSIAGRVDPIMAMGAQLLIGGVPLMAGAVFFEDIASVDWSANFLFILIAISLFGSSLAYWMWSEILRTTELSRANAFSFLVPAFGLAMGAMFFGERIGLLEFAGIGLTLAGITLANHRDSADNQPATELRPETGESP